jgi:hypothetical protein
MLYASIRKMAVLLCPSATVINQGRGSLEAPDIDLAVRIQLYASLQHYSRLIVKKVARRVPLYQ